MIPTRPGPARLHTLQDRLDLRGVVGNGIKPSVLKEAGIEDTDMPIDCAQRRDQPRGPQSGQGYVQRATTIARVRSPKFQDDSPMPGTTGFAVDKVICPEQSVTACTAS